MIGRGLTTSQIAAKLHRSVKTVEAHREGLKVKLDLSVLFHVDPQKAPNVWRPKPTGWC